jgi:hypothetical protein
MLTLQAAGIASPIAADGILAAVAHAFALRIAHRDARVRSVQARFRGRPALVGANDIALGIIRHLQVCRGQQFEGSKQTDTYS